jgi:putative DNA primase/helicase
MRCEPSPRVLSRYPSGDAVNQAKGVDLANVLQDARLTVKDLDAHLKDNPGYIFDTPAVLEAIHQLKRHDAGAWSRIKEACKKRGILREVEQHLRTMTSEAATTEQDRTQRGTVGSVLPDAPLPEAIIPYPYFVTAESTGLYHKRTEHGAAIEVPVEFTNAPLLITGRLHDIHTGAEHLCLQWRRHQWCQRVIDRRQAFDAHKLIELASFNFPVADHNEGDIARYLFEFESANYSLIPQTQISSHLGWQGHKGDRGFLWGRTLIAADGQTVAGVELGSLPPEDWREDFVMFYGGSEGEHQLADGFRQGGTLDGWQGVVAKLRPYPKAMLGVYTSFVSPLLEILGLPNFVIDWSNRSSTGKTTVLRPAASVWGNPDERSREGSILFSWNLTKVWLGYAAGTLASMPLIVDETKLAQARRRRAGAVHDRRGSR